MLGRPRVANFDIIKVTIMIIKTAFRNSIKVKRITNYVLKWNFVFITQYDRNI